MPAIDYTVTARFERQDLADEFVDWLRNGHMQALLRGGADRAELVRGSEPEDEQPTVTARYRFPNRAVFDAYLQDHAPRLQEEGLEKFPTSRGVAFSRSVGEILLPR